MRFTFSTKGFRTWSTHDREMASNGSNNGSSASANPKTQQVVSPKPVERLFPFALRARIVATGEQTLKAIRKKIGFLLLTEDISLSRVHQILKQFPGIPVYQRYTSEDFKTFFGYQQTKVIGFRKSALTSSILKEFKSLGLSALQGKNSAP